MTGLDTSHVVAFTRLLNDPAAAGHISGAVVTVAFRSGAYGCFGNLAALTKRCCAGWTRLPERAR